MSQTVALLQAVREIEPILRQYAAEAEQERKLSVPVAKAFKDAGLYRMWRPKALGGFERDPVSGLRVIEAVSRIDSAAGWNLQIAVAHDLFAPWFGDKAAAEIFHADAIPVGAFNPPRLAIPVEGGYRISGRTPLVSGAHHASVYLGFAKVHDGGDEHPVDRGPRTGSHHHRALLTPNTTSRPTFAITGSKTTNIPGNYRPTSPPKAMPFCVRLAWLKTAGSRIMPSAKPWSDFYIS